MDYKNEKCPVCGQEFKNEDDIVVCPVCGTPHHRECWAKENHCANEALHSGGFEWKKSAPEKEDEAPQFQQSAEQPEVGSPDAPISPVMFSSAEITDDVFENICMRGVNAKPDDTFEGMRIGDIAFYIQQNARHYINKFIKGKKVTFNWAALIFAPAWFFYRKLYKAGAIFLALTVAISLFTYPLTNALVEEEREIYEMMDIDPESNASAKDEIAEYLKGENSEEIMAKTADYVKKGTLLLALKILPQIAAALCANEIYKRKIKKNLDIINGVSQDKATKRMLISQRGRVSLLWGAVVFIAADYLVPMLVSAGKFFMDLF